MTRSRSLAIVSCFFLLFRLASGQQVEVQPDLIQLTEEQILALESLAADSTGGDLVVPNVFTPNGDGNNDYFEVTTNGTTVYEFSVFTRTGSRIYHSLSPRIFWDGTSNAGLELKEAVYYYVIEEEGDSEPFTRAGFIYLFR